jgi:hypothetical protein
LNIQVDPLEPPEALDDSVDLLFADLVDWSIVDRRGYSPYRFNEREVVRFWADKAIDPIPPLYAVYEGDRASHRYILPGQRGTPRVVCMR